MKNILLINYEDIPMKRNPIAILDIASYCRSLGYNVTCRYTTNVTEADFQQADVIGLSSIHPPPNLSPITYAEYLIRKYDKQVVIGGKWAKAYAAKTLKIT